MTKAKWYFDFLSPFAYLQLARFQKLPPNLEVTTVPVVFGAILKHWGPESTFAPSTPLRAAGSLSRLLSAKW